MNAVAQAATGESAASTTGVSAARPGHGFGHRAADNLVERRGRSLRGARTEGGAV